MRFRTSIFACTYPIRTFVEIVDASCAAVAVSVVASCTFPSEVNAPAIVVNADRSTGSCAVPLTAKSAAFSVPSSTEIAGITTRKAVASALQSAANGLSGLPSSHPICTVQPAKTCTRIPGTPCLSGTPAISGSEVSNGRTLTLWRSPDWEITFARYSRRYGPIESVAWAAFQVSLIRSLTLTSQSRRSTAASGRRGGELRDQSAGPPV